MCPADESAFRYRYDGLVLMVVSGGQYLLIPREWERGTSSVVSVPKADAVRLDHLSPPTGAQPLRSPADDPDDAPADRC
ncbi:hypothetical protein [Promicromonospora sp. NPDC060271]|uniref:hypothetical protein n=1 Tax=Promicromonospora sp. NPDC060271 TaxID=3347089 RepID=UPI00365CAA0A